MPSRRSSPKEVNVLEARLQEQHKGKLEEIEVLTKAVAERELHIENCASEKQALINERRELVQASDIDKLQPVSAFIAPSSAPAVGHNGNLEVDVGMVAGACGKGKGGKLSNPAKGNGAGERWPCFEGCWPPEVPRRTSRVWV